VFVGAGEISTPGLSHFSRTRQSLIPEKTLTLHGLRFLYLLKTPEID